MTSLAGRIGKPMVVLVVVAAAVLAGTAGASDDKQPVGPSREVGVKTDVLLILDTSGSMENALKAASAKVQRIAQRLEKSVGRVAFGVAEVRDYGIKEFRGVKGDKPFRVVQPMTTDAAEVKAALSALKTRNPGGIAPEAYGRALRDAVADRGVSWRPGSRRMILLVADDLPHDDNLNEGIPRRSQLRADQLRNLPDPGDDEKIGTADDIDWQRTLARLSKAGVPIMFLLFEGRSEYLPYWREWTSRTGGQAREATEGDLSRRMVEVAKKGAVARLPECPSGMTRGADRKCRPSGGCPTVSILAAVDPGSEQIGSTISSFRDALRKRVEDESGDLNLRTVEVPATQVEAVNAIQDRLDAEVAACRKTGTRFAVVGEGQAAEAIGDAVGYEDDQPGDVTSKALAAAVLFSDPKANGDDLRRMRGGFELHAEGRLGKRSEFDSEISVFSFCKAGDENCGGSKELGGTRRGGYEHEEAKWAANLVGNEVFGAVDQFGIDVSAGSPFWERDEGGELVKHVPLNVETDRSGTVQLRVRPGVNQRRYGMASGILVFDGPGEKTLDFALPGEGTRNEESRSMMRLPSQGPGLSLFIQAAGSAEQSKETTRSVMEPVGRN